MDPTNPEYQVIGSMLLEPDIANIVSDIITGADYYSPTNEAIHNQILKLQEQSIPIEPATVWDQLNNFPSLKDVGGLVYLHECMDVVASPWSASHYAQMVKKESARRQIKKISTHLDQAATETTLDPQETIADALARFQQITTSPTTNRSLAERAKAALASLDDPHGPPTPWPSLTRSINGWAPGMLYVAGGRPGIGKTQLGIGASLSVAQMNKRSIFFSMEMLERELLLRTFSAVGEVPTTAVQSRKLTKQQYVDLNNAVETVGNLPLVIDDRTNISLTQIRATIEREKAKGEVGLVVVDYLSLVKQPTGAPNNDRRVAVDLIAQGLKNIAMDLEVPVLALAQLNRGIEGRAEKVPTLADLRESGGIEAAADVVLLMHRDTIAAPEKLLIVVAKNRHGPQAMITLQFEGIYSRITDPHPTHHLRSI